MSPNGGRRSGVRAAGRCARPNHSLDLQDDLGGEWWRVRYHVAMRAACYLTIRIRQPHLRARVVEHMAVCWWRCCANGGYPDGLSGLFREYCADVERDVDVGTSDRDWELHRVWTNHAAVLGGDLDEVHDRLTA
jgi:hypothetical protein